MRPASNGHGPVQVVDLALEIGGSLDARDVMTRVLNRGLAVVHADRATLSTLEDDVLTIQVTSGLAGDLTWIGRSYPLESLMVQPTIRTVLESRQPALGGQLDVALAEPEFRAALEAVHHTAAIPLLDDGAVVGLLVLSRLEDPAFTESDLGTLSLIGELSGLALRNAALHEAEQTARARAHAAREGLQLAMEAARKVASEESVPEVLQRVLTAATLAGGADGGAVAHLDGDDLVLDAVTGNTPMDARWPVGEATRSAIRAGRPQEVPASMPLSTPNGTEHVVARYRRLLVAPLVAEGEPVSVVALGRAADVPFGAERILALQQFTPLAALLLRNARLLERAREAEHAKSEFMNIAVHEFKSPLTVVLGYASMVLDGVYGEVPADMRKALHLVVEKSHEALALAQELLTVARLEGNALEARSVIFDVADTARRAAAREQARAALAEGTVHSDGPRALPARGDSELTMRILANLITNALVYCDSSPRVDITWQAGDGTTEIAVRDQGWGIEPADHGRIFERFERGSGSHVTRSGSGLGLYVSRRMAQLMGGDLTLRESSPGAGSTFVLSLPVT